MGLLSSCSIPRGESAGVSGDELEQLTKDLGEGELGKLRRKSQTAPGREGPHLHASESC